MGFPLVCYCMSIPKPVIVFCRLLSAIRDAVLLMLAVVGLCRFPLDGARRSADAQHRPEEVKSRLPAVEYAQLLAEQQPSSSSSSPTITAGTHHAACCHHDGGEEDDACASAAADCIVCLETLEARDEVRRLGNCAHAFHRACIDRWIDLGRATCPLCRADLLPRPRGRAGPGAGRAGPARHPSQSHPRARLVRTEEDRPSWRGSFVFFSMARLRPWAVAEVAVAVAAHLDGGTVVPEWRAQVGDGDRADRRVV